MLKDTRIIIDFSDDVKELLRSFLGATPAIPAIVVAAVAEVLKPIEIAPTKVISLTLLRETINSKIAENKTSLILSLLASFGAASASTLPKENFEAFYDHLIKL